MEYTCLLAQSLRALPSFLLSGGLVLVQRDVLHDL